MGYFPKGGGCRFCGSNRHFATKCPERGKNKIPRVEGEEGEGGDYLSEDEGGKVEEKKKAVASSSNPPTASNPEKKTKKIVKF